MAENEEEEENKEKLKKETKRKLEQLIFKQKKILKETPYLVRR